MECYLREKRDAILEDRKVAAGPLHTSLDPKAEDEKSNLEKV